MTEGRRGQHIGGGRPFAPGVGRLRLVAARHPTAAQAGGPNPGASEPHSRLGRLDQPSRPVSITGATGTLGQAMARTCEWRGIDYVLTARSQLSLDDDASILRALDRYRPWAVINAVGWVRGDLPGRTESRQPLDQPRFASA